jgi:chemotaxis protein CheY-P-specific phosphatase CheC
VSKQHLGLWLKLIEDDDLPGVLRLALWHVASCLSDLTYRSITLNSVQLEVVPCNELALACSDPEAETVGIYLRMGDELPGQALFILSLDDALYLTDWLLQTPLGITTRLDELGSSALAELGNVALAAFLNTLAEFNRSPLRLSPPTIMVDTLATTLQVVATSVDDLADELLVIKADFRDEFNSIEIRFWLLPDPAILKFEKIQLVALNAGKV